MTIGGRSEIEEVNYICYEKFSDSLSYELCLYYIDKFRNYAMIFGVNFEMIVFVELCVGNSQNQESYPLKKVYKLSFGTFEKYDISSDHLMSYLIREFYEIN